MFYKRNATFKKKIRRRCIIYAYLYAYIKNGDFIFSQKGGMKLRNLFYFHHYFVNRNSSKTKNQETNVKYMLNVVFQVILYLSTSEQSAELLMLKMKE